MRQYRFLYTQDPQAWAVALVCLWAPPICLALAAPSFVAGSPGAWIALAFVTACGEVRTRLRRAVQRTLWPHLEGNPRQAAVARRAMASAHLVACARAMRGQGALHGRSNGRESPPRDPAAVGDRGAPRRSPVTPIVALNLHVRKARQCPGKNIVTLPLALASLPIGLGATSADQRLGVGLRPSEGRPGPLGARPKSLSGTGCVC